MSNPYRTSTLNPDPTVSARMCWRRRLRIAAWAWCVFVAVGLLVGTWVNALTAEGVYVASAWGILIFVHFMSAIGASAWLVATSSSSDT